MRGEDDTQNHLISSHLGSPPHAWGRPSALRLRNRLHRFTPTCVGKTSTSSLHNQASSVHPHMRGEDSKSAWTFEQFIRFTPTCVGKTYCTARTSCTITVHPHMRGEDFGFVIMKSSFSGSPPHAWGRPARVSALMVGVRFTPTCVGKTVELHKICDDAAVHPHMRGEDKSSRGSGGSAPGSPPHAWGRPF